MERLMGHTLRSIGTEEAAKELLVLTLEHDHK